VKVNDAVTGAMLVALAAVVLWHIQSFPAMPGQKFGPAWFPGLIAIGLAVCGARLVYAGVRRRGPWMTLPEWAHRGRPRAAAASVLVGLGFYVLAADRLGFHLTALLLMTLWTRLMGAPWRIVVPVAVLAPIVIHLAFYKLLRIPLPWGVLERFAF
jgi:putative tricarboxylic transport membrane protein